MKMKVVDKNVNQIKLNNNNNNNKHSSSKN